MTSEGEIEFTEVGNEVRCRLGHLQEMKVMKTDKENKMKSKKQNKAGFTLVELMVVAIIVAILAAVAIPLMSGNKLRAAATEGQAGCSTVATAIRMLKVEDGDYSGAASHSGAPAGLPGISGGDLNGTYFNDASYGIASSASNFTITATAMASGPDSAIASKTVIMTVAGDGSASWSGTLLD